MANIRPAVRRSVRWVHLWLGLVGGAFVVLMGVTGGIVALRPQTASLLSPASASGACVNSVDWTQAERDVRAIAGTEVNRIYFPEAGDSRIHFRMAGDSPKIFRHVIYDSCAGGVSGVAGLEWLDWVIDLHHNLRLTEETGRYWVGLAGALTLIGAATGCLYWLLGPGAWKSRFIRLFKFQSGQSTLKSSLDLHRLFGLASAALLVAASFTGLCVCFPQNTRAILAWVTEVPGSTRANMKGSRDAKSKGAPAGLNDLISAAQRAIPQGRIREIRFPEGSGPVQVRMWLPGDFRSLGNNQVSLDRSAKVTAVDLYAGKPAVSRFIQAMTALHFGEWGGLAYRGAYAGAGFASALLMITGVLLYWLPRQKRPSSRS